MSVQRVWDSAHLRSRILEFVVDVPFLSLFPTPFVFFDQLHTNSLQYVLQHAIDHHNQWMVKWALNHHRQNKSEGVLASTVLNFRPVIGDPAWDDVIDLLVVAGWTKSRSDAHGSTVAAATGRGVADLNMIRQRWPQFVKDSLEFKGGRARPHVLHVASMNGHNDVVRDELANSVVEDRRFDFRDISAIVQGGHLETIQILYEYNDTSLYDCIIDDVLYSACQFDKNDILDWVQSVRPDLHMAVEGYGEWMNMTKTYKKKLRGKWQQFHQWIERHDVTNTNEFIETNNNIDTSGYLLSCIYDAAIDDEQDQVKWLVDTFHLRFSDENKSSMVNQILFCSKVKVLYLDLLRERGWIPTITPENVMCAALSDHIPVLDWLRRHMTDTEHDAIRRQYFVNVDIFIDNWLRRLSNRVIMWLHEHFEYCLDPMMISHVFDLQPWVSQWWTFTGTRYIPFVMISSHKTELLDWWLSHTQFIDVPGALEFIIKNKALLDDDILQLFLRHME